MAPPSRLNRPGTGRPAARVLRWFTTGTTTAGLALAAVPLAAAPLTAGSPPSAASASLTPAAQALLTLPPGTGLALISDRNRLRKIKRYRVRPGDTPSSIAVRFHAWTDELVARNGRVLFVGEVITISVVRKAQRACKRHRHHHTNIGRSRDGGHGKPGRPTKPGSAKPSGHKRPGHDVRHRTGWHHADASRPQVRRAITAKARRHGVDPDLALAVAWQESGWQQRRVSTAGALGAMQIMPGTGRWMSQVLGRRLNPRDLYHNASAGVGLIRLLRTEARPRIATRRLLPGTRRCPARRDAPIDEGVRRRRTRPAEADLRRMAATLTRPAGRA